LTLLDFVKQFVRVHILDKDWSFYESGDDPELFLENLLENYEGDEETTEYYCKRDFTTVEEALEDEPGHFIQDLIYAAWLTNNGTTYDDADEDVQQVENCTYEICIGSDYETRYETDIDLT